jgi:prophage regulatory protein
MSFSHPASPGRMLNIAQVAAYSGLSRSMIYRLIKRGAFPPQMQLIPGGRRVGWHENAVIEWATDPLSWGEAL